MYQITQKKKAKNQEKIENKSLAESTKEKEKIQRVMS